MPAGDLVRIRPAPGYKGIHAGQTVTVLEEAGDRLLVECEDEHGFWVTRSQVDWSEEGTL